MNEFDTAVVTGANRGIGLELCRQLAAISRGVVATCRDPSAAGELQTLAAGHAGVEIVALDVTDQAGMTAFCRQFADRPVDLLINNAGYYGPKAQARVDLPEWRRVLEVNTLAPVNLALQLMDAVVASNRRLIVNISSKVGSMADNTSGGAIMYRSSKAALNAATRSLAIDHRSDGVIVLAMHPGWVKTAMGGPNALIDSAASAGQLLAVIRKAELAQSGQFLDRDGSVIPW